MQNSNSRKVQVKMLSYHALFLPTCQSPYVCLKRPNNQSAKPRVAPIIISGRVHFY